MSEFLTTHAAAYQIENIIRTARTRLVLVSPYLQLSKLLFERLRDADGRGVKTSIILRKDALKEAERNQLQALINVTIYFCANLHAKCYFNEECMIITSMNMYEYSEKTNREMGVLIKKSEDEKLFTAADQEVKSIMDAAILERDNHAPGASERSPRHESPTSSSRQSRVPSGFCIRCGYEMEFDPDRPLCHDCYLDWADFGNPYYAEQFCHLCGIPNRTSKDKPLCSVCFSRVFK